MRTTDLFKINRSSKRLNESLEKMFGQKLDLASFDLEKLQDARNKLRTQISQVRSESGFNETVENEAFAKAQFILDAINSEILEREEFISDPHVAEVSEEADNLSPEDFFVQVAAAGDDGYDMLYSAQDGEYGPEVQKAVQDMYDNVSIDSGHHPDDGHEEIYNQMLDNIEADYGASSFGQYPSGEMGEEAPPTAKGERMVKHIKAAYAKDGKLTDKEKSIAYATAWKAHNKNESVNTGEDMTKLNEGEIQQASAIVTAKTMVDRVGRWIEELSGMENDTLLQLGDSIRDEMSAELAKSFISTCAPAIQQALEGLKQTRETLASGVRTLTGEEQAAGMLGGEEPGAAPGGEEDFFGPSGEDAMNAGGEEGGLEAEPTDEFAASEPGAGGAEAAGRMKRESVEYSNNLLKVLAG